MNCYFSLFPHRIVIILNPSSNKLYSIYLEKLSIFYSHSLNEYMHPLFLLKYDVFEGVMIMQWQQKIRSLIGHPVGISLANGQGTSGVLCGTDGGKLFVIEYLYQTQFALKQYEFYIIKDINGFPPCHNQQLLF